MSPHRKFIFPVFVLLIISMLSTALPVNAQAGEPPQPDGAQDIDIRESSPAWLPMSGEGYAPWGQDGDTAGSWDLAPEDASIQAPYQDQDEFGYFESTTPYNWIEAATTGTVLELDSTYNTSQKIDLPFDFPFYGETYSFINVTSFGYLTVGNTDPVVTQSHIVDPSSPNNVIAGYWTITDLATSGATNRVYVLSGGTAPNRYFLVEYNNLRVASGIYTFEIVLHENGDIDISYQEMLNIDYCGSEGIEDYSGQIGRDLMQYGYCSDVYGYELSTRKLKYPDDRGRVRVVPTAYGEFGRAGQTVDFPLTLTNDGDFGADVYDFKTTSNWPVEFFTADGKSTLTDTNGNGRVNTSQVEQDASIQVIARVSVPVQVSIGETDTATLEIYSNNEGQIPRQLTLTTTVSAPFVSISSGYPDGKVSLEVSGPSEIRQTSLSGNGSAGDEPVVVETANRNIFTAWKSGRCVENDCYRYVQEIYYSLAGSSGSFYTAPNRLADQSGASNIVRVLDLAAATSPDGRILLAWTQVLSSNEGLTNYNIYTAVAGEDGSIIQEPTRLTENSIWNPVDGMNYTYYSSTAAAAAGDDHFIVAWNQNNGKSGDGVKQDVYYAVMDSEGAEVKQVTALTNASQTDDYPGYYSVHAAEIQDGKVLLMAPYGYDAGIRGFVLDENGNVTINDHNFTWNATSADASSYSYEPDAILLPNGNIAVVWIEYRYHPAYYRCMLEYVILSESLYQVTQPAFLENEGALSGFWEPSITTDSANHVIITAYDETMEYGNIYYALVNGADGTAIQQPTLVGHADGGLTHSKTGSGNTTHSPAESPSSEADIYVNAPALVGVQPGGKTTYTIRYGNQGLASSTGGTLTVTLDGDLVIEGVTPSGGEDYQFTMDVGAMEYGSTGEISYIVTIPDAPVGTKYPITVQLTAQGDSTPENNSVNGALMAALQDFLPILQRH